MNGWVNKLNDEGQETGATRYEPGMVSGNSLNKKKLRKQVTYFGISRQGHNMRRHSCKRKIWEMHRITNSLMCPGLK